jgi:hypothetical protein
LEMFGHLDPLTIITQGTKPGNTAFHLDWPREKILGYPRKAVFWSEIDHVDYGRHIEKLRRSFSSGSCEVSLPSFPEQNDIQNKPDSRGHGFDYTNAL